MRMRRSYEIALVELMELTEMMSLRRATWQVRRCEVAMLKVMSDSAVRRKHQEENRMEVEVGSYAQVMSAGQTPATFLSLTVGR